MLPLAMGHYLVLHTTYTSCSLVCGASSKDIICGSIGSSMASSYCAHLVHGGGCGSSCCVSCDTTGGVSSCGASGIVIRGSGWIIALLACGGTLYHMSCGCGTCEIMSVCATSHASISTIFQKTSEEIRFAQ
eukprot:237937_1